MSRIPVPSHHSTSPHHQTSTPTRINTTLTERDTNHLAPSSPSMSAASYRNSPAAPASSAGSDAFDTRKRQSRRDEAIRKKIEGELNRKAGKPSTPSANRSGNNRRRGGHGRGGSTIIAGTVSALRPLPALTVPQNISVADASQLCAAKRTDCVLVVDDDEHLAGIFTAKDLAFRVVAGGSDARTTPVSAIMTRSPMVTRDSTSATEALNTMVTRGFRHLPVCNDEGDVVGLLDIAKVFYEALEKLERAHGSSQKLYNALEGVQSEWGPSAGPQNAMLQYVEALRQRMSLPDLSTILDSRTLPCTVGVRTTVCDAAKMMKEHHTTAVCVMEGGANGQPQKIAGIFTSKDVVLRVIAAGLDPKTCSVVRVMTPHPDTAPPSLSIQEALRKMHDGRYLNLPVVDVDQRLVGVVDVLKLTYATLEQINSMNDGSSGDENGAGAGGPMWNRFWNSFGQSSGSVGGTADDGTESALSNSHQPQHAGLEPQTPSRFSTADVSSDVHPNDSASAVGDGARGTATEDAVSGVGLPSAAAAAAAEVDDGTYLFKFVTPSGRTHRFQARYDSFETIREIVCIKLSGDPFFDAPSPKATTATNEEGGAAAAPISPPDPNDFSLAYTDDDDDLVLMTADGDVSDAVKVVRKQGKDRVVLLLQGGKGWEEASVRLGYGSGAAAANGTSATAMMSNKKKQQREAIDAQLQSVEEEEERENEAEVGGATKDSDTPARKPKAKKAKDDEELLFGVLPKDLALPAAVGFLGVAVLAAVALTRTSSSNRF